MDIIKESIKNLKIENTKNRENYVNKLLDYYNGNSIGDYIKPRFAVEAFAEIPPFETNITHKFINKLSRVYTIGAVRNGGDI